MKIALFIINVAFRISSNVLLFGHIWTAFKLTVFSISVCMLFKFVFVYSTSAQYAQRNLTSLWSVFRNMLFATLRTIPEGQAGTSSTRTYQVTPERIHGQKRLHDGTKVEFFID